MGNPGTSGMHWHAMREVAWIQEVHLWGMSVGGKSEKAEVMKNGEDFRRIR